VAERKAAGLTQTVLAQRLGKPPSFVAKYELGERRLDLLEYLDIAAAIDFDPYELIRCMLSAQIPQVRVGFRSRGAAGVASSKAEARARRRSPGVANSRLGRGGDISPCIMRHGQHPTRSLKAEDL
jgi:transcriptional regulator with XRE-family HTH domain